MIKRIAAYCGIALGISCLLPIMWSAEANAQYISLNPSLRDLAFELKTPEAIADFMWKNFRFEKDQRQFGKSEYWQSPDEFLQNGKGDCEDFSIFAQAMLKAAGIRTFLLNIYGSGYGHTVCVFQENGKYHIIDESKVVRHNADSLEELCAKINPFWTKSAVVSAHSASKKGLIVKQMSR